MDDVDGPWKRGTTPGGPRRGTEETAGAGAPREGDIVAGKYRVERFLGAGGMGVVVLAEQIHLKRRVALKLLRPSASAESVTRFLREAQATATLKSEHIVRVIDVCETATGQLCLVMEYLDGHDLRRSLEAGERLDARTAAVYLRQVCDAIAEAHAAGIVHRDIKPENLFLTIGRDGAPLVKVLDFGISKRMPTDGGQPSSLTTTHDALGTPSYMSPEQVRNAARVDARTDVWALGVVLYELVAGAPPFAAISASAMSAAIVADAPLPLRVRCPELAPAFERIVMRCLEKDPDRRFASASELALALEPFARGASPARAHTTALAVAVGVVGMVAMIASRFAPAARASSEALGTVPASTSTPTNAPVTGSAAPWSMPSAGVGGGAPANVSALRAPPPSVAPAPPVSPTRGAPARLGSSHAPSAGASATTSVSADPLEDRALLRRK